MLDAALDLLLGSNCAACGRPGRALCPPCDAELPRGARVSMPMPAPEGMAVVLATGEYDGALRALVNAHKERGRLALARPLGRLLADAAGVVVPRGPLVLVPVPSNRAAVRRRGHDPLLRVTRIAASTLRRSGRDVWIARLLRQAHRPMDQAQLDAKTRRANLAGAFETRAGIVAGPVVVVDDVVTTGATAREAQRALELAGIEVAGIAAVAATRRRRPVESL